MTKTKEWIAGSIPIYDFSEALEWLQLQQTDNLELWLKNYLLDFDSSHSQNRSYGSHIAFDENHHSMDPKRDVLLRIYIQGNQFLKREIVNAAKNVRRDLSVSVSDLERKATESVTNFLSGLNKL